MSLRVSQLSLKVGAKTLLNEIDFQLEAGEVVAILGPNGAGKSTLFKTLAGEHRFYRGEISLHGRNLKEWRAQDIAKVLAVLPQSSQLAFPFSAAEVVNLGRMPHDTGRAADRQIVAQALALADVSHLAQALYPSLSGGERQRVQLARVLAQIWHPSALGERFLLLDEPTSALDLAHQHQTLQSARKLACDGVGVLAILHDLNLAAQYADRILLLENGWCIAQGGVEQVLTAAQIEQLFGLPVTVMRHPVGDFPMVVTTPQY
ncbi:MAG: heme ABC transporter ATP-binding protein [Pseudomonadales bacterium]